MKQCGRCKIVYPFSNFHIKRSSKDGYNKFCKSCRSNENISKREYIYKKKVELGGCCQRCGFDNIVCLEFHHLRDKNGLVSRMNKKSDIDNEILKCELICSFCHHLENKHSKNRDYKVKRNYDFVDGVKINIGLCNLCSRRVDKCNVSAFHFDHLFDKFKNVSFLCKNQYSIESIRNEIEKCQLICSNCHFLKTTSQFNRMSYLI